MFFLPTGYTRTTQAHSFTTTTCFYGAIKTAMMWAISSPDHFKKNRLSWHWRRIILVAAVVNLASVQRYHLWKRCDCDKADNGLFGEGVEWICVLQTPSLPLQTFTFEMPLVVCLLSPNVSGITNETNQTNTFPPAASGRADSFLVFHGFPPSPLNDGSEWTSMAPKTKCQNDVYCTLYPSFILPAIPFSLCAFPFSFLCVYIPVSPCLPGFPRFFFFFVFFSIFHSLSASSFSRSQDMQMTRGLARQSDSTVPRPARER